MKPSPARILFRGAIPLLVAAAAFVPPRAQVKGLTSLDLVQLRRVTSLAVRPDGSQVAYLLDVSQPLESDPEGPDRSEVRLVDLIGASRPVATGLDDAGHLRWMPDGRELSFLAREEGSGRRVLHVLNLDDRRVRVVGMQAADIEAYSWAPDGGRVAALAAAPHRGVWITGSSGEPRAVEVPGLVSAVRWSPVGSRLAIAASDGLYVVDADSGARLSHRKIPALLTMEWSPDGESLALIASDAPERMEGRLTVIPALDGEGREPYPGAGAHVRAVAWVDSETLLFLAEEGVWSILARVGHDGTGHRTAVGPGRAMWNDIDVSRDGGSVALLGESPGHPSEVFLLDMGEPIKITDLARRMIRLAGLIPEVDINIEYTGRRPGEKLEETLANGSLEATSNPKVFEVPLTHPGAHILATAVADLEDAALAGETRQAVSLLSALAEGSLSAQAYPRMSPSAN